MNSTQTNEAMVADWLASAPKTGFNCVYTWLSWKRGFVHWPDTQLLFNYSGFSGLLVN